MAEASVSGAHVTVAGNAWRGLPHNLDAVLSPLQVTIENQSGHPVRVRSADFALVGSNGFHYSALSPLNLQDGSGNGSPRADLPPLPADAYAIGVAELAYHRPWPPRFINPHFYPGWSFYSPGWYPWAYGWPYDPYYHGSPVSLPTRDMIEQALPEGVVDNGGRVGGFLFFRGVSNREQQVTFEMQINDATSGEKLGTLAIPLLVAH